MKNADHQKDFLSLINEIDRSKHRAEVFQDFCEMAYCALAKIASPSIEQRDKLETNYLATVGRYKKEDAEKIAHLLAITTLALADGGTDFLGGVAAEMAVLDPKLGQFFTPYDVSRMMAEITLNGIEETINENGFVTIQEPALGAGSMILAARDKVAGFGFDPATTMWVEGVELNRKTYFMGFIQLTLSNIPARVYQANSLTLETFDASYTSAASVFVTCHGYPFKKQSPMPERLAAKETIQPAPSFSVGQQLSLF